MSAFVQIPLAFWMAWRTGQLSDEERDLGLYVAFEADARTDTLVTTLGRLSAELDWQVAETTAGRRLRRLEELGFVTSEVHGRSPNRKHALHPTYKLRKSLQIAQEYAALHAGIDAAIEPSAHAGSPDTRAGIDAALDAGEREDREDINLPSSTSDVGREGIKTAATDNGPRPPVANNGKAPGELSEEELRRLEASGETGKQLATRVRKRRGAPA